MNSRFLPKPLRVLAAAAAGLALGAGLISCGKKTDAAAKDTPMMLVSTTTTSDAPPEVLKMLGRWLRTDGTYALELRGADRSGVVQAAYFNPRSIHVSRAIWMRGAEGLQVVVELNDVGYPGATYVLSHDTAQDRLVGRYNQPQMGQTFEIEFVRQKKFP